MKAAAAGTHELAVLNFTDEEQAVKYPQKQKPVKDSSLVRTIIRRFLQPIAAYRKKKRQQRGRIDAWEDESPTKFVEEQIPGDSVAAHFTNTATITTNNANNLDLANKPPENTPLLLGQFESHNQFVEGQMPSYSVPAHFTITATITPNNANNVDSADQPPENTPLLLGQSESQNHSAISNPGCHDQEPSPTEGGACCVTDGLPMSERSEGLEDTPSLATSQSGSQDGQSRGIHLGYKAIDDIKKLRDEFGLFTYYVLEDRKIVIHAEDDTAKAQISSIVNAISTIVQLCHGEDTGLEIIKTEKSFNARLCAIGAPMTVNKISQTIGMYLQHEGIVYWVSVAHNLNPLRCDPMKNCISGAVGIEGTDLSSEVVRLAEGIETLGSVDEQRLMRAPTSFACFSCNPLPCVGGQLLMHYVDIMMGPMPLPAALVETGMAWYPGSMHEVFTPCSTCGSDTNRCEHGVNSREYAISDVLHLEKKIETYGDMKICFYDGSQLIGEILHCRPQQQNVVTGKVMAWQTGVLLQSKGTPSLERVLFIMPTGRVGPREGDCGSIWVLKSRAQAVAITVGMGEMTISDRQEKRQKAVWLAVLLDPALEAFCATHFHIFKSPSDFKPLVQRRNRSSLGS